MASNSKRPAELRSGTVKATVWENEVGGVTHHNVTFSRIYPDGASGRPLKTSVSSTSSPLPSSPTRHTRSLQSARPRWPVRLAMTKPRKTAAPSGGGLIPVAFFYGRLSRREAAARRFEQRSSRRMFQRVLCIAAAANTRPQCNLRHFSLVFGKSMNC